MAKKSSFKGLMAYNHIVKTVKAELESQGIELKKGKYFQEAPNCSFRDIVKKSWAGAKGKSKKKASEVAVSIVGECLASGGYLKRKRPSLPPEGENIVDNVHYWEIGDYLNKLIPDGANVWIDNGVYGGIDDYEGDIEGVDSDVLSSIFSELNLISNTRKWDSSNAATYKVFFDPSSNQYIARLIDNEGRDEGLEERVKDWKEKQADDFSRLQKKDLEKLRGGEKVKPIIDTFIDDQARREAKKKADIQELALLDKKKESLMKSFEMYKAIDDKVEMKRILGVIKSIDRQIEEL